MMNGIEMIAALRGRQVHMCGLGTLGRRYVDAFVAMLAPFADKEDVEIHLWDGDNVEERNLRNQGFLPEHVGMPKAEARLAQARAVFPASKLRIVPHVEWVTAETALSGFVLSGVDSMRERRVVLEATKRAGDAVSFFGDGRLGLDGGKAYGFDPNNPQHLSRYEEPVHNHDDPLVPDRPCKEDMPLPYMADITAGHVVARLAEWLSFERGSTNPYMHFIGFCFEPRFTCVEEYWDEGQPCG